MSPFFYISIWLLYLIAVVLALVGAWRVSRGWPYPLKLFGRIALVVIFLTPSPHVASGDWLAPAFISMMFDQLQGLQDGWFRAGIYLIISGTFGFLLYLLALGRWIFGERRKLKNRD